MTKDEFQKRLSQRIINLRTDKGWSPSDLARAANKDRQAIDKLESGEINPTGYTLYEIAEALGVDLAVLMNLKDASISSSGDQSN